MTDIRIGNVPVGLDEGLFVIAGPCVIESLDGCLGIAESLIDVREKTGVPVIFKVAVPWPPPV